MGSNISTSNEKTLIPVDEAASNNNGMDQIVVFEDKISMVDQWIQNEKLLLSKFGGLKQPAQIVQCESNKVSLEFKQEDIEISQHQPNPKAEFVQVKSKMDEKDEDQLKQPPSSYIMTQSDKKSAIKQNKQSIIALRKEQNGIKELFLSWLKELYDKYGKYSPPEIINTPGAVKVSLRQESDGSYYEGEEVNGQKNGYGYQLFSEEFYEGYFVDSARCGWGRLLTQEAVKSGYWKGIEIEREMEIITKEYQCKGGCTQSKLNGYGVYETKKFKYEGNFKGGKREGKGVFYFKEDQSRYEGDFQEDIFSGEGTYNFKSGKIYQGQFQNGVFHGKGEMKWPNGKVYNGYYALGIQKGYGTLIDSDGSTYQGQFDFDKKNGYGTYFQNGVQVEGQWKNDEYQEE